MILRYTFMLYLILASGASTVWAQQHSVIGTITDAENGETLIGVNVLVEGTEIGVSTNNEGEYSLSGIPENGFLVITYIGYVQQRIPINGQSVINVSLQLSE